MENDNKKYTLFIISPSDSFSEKISSVLNKGNFTVISVPDEQHAFHRFKSACPDLILFKPESSASDNCNVVRQIRKNTTTQNIPIIFISSIDDETVISECLRFEFTDFITTPLREKELLLRIRHQLSLIEAQRTIERQNEKLQQTLQDRDRLYAVIAHDLRSPIGTIKMINSAIENEKEKILNASIRKKFEMINETTEEAYNLLENLLRWTRNQNGKTKIIPTQFDLSVTVRQVLSLFTTIAKAKKITLVNYLTRSLPVYADEDMIKTVLRNLVSNAIKFTFPQGKVELLVTENARNVTIAVKDNGQGIKKENQCLLLKGEQVVSTYGTRNEKGCGLGLLLSQDFVKQNKGELYFTSEEGKGTTFYFTIPRLAD